MEGHAFAGHVFVNPDNARIIDGCLSRQHGLTGRACARRSVISGVLRVKKYRRHIRTARDGDMVRGRGGRTEMSGTILIPGGSQTGGATFTTA